MLKQRECTLNTWVNVTVSKGLNIRADAPCEASSAAMART